MGQFDTNLEKENSVLFKMNEGDFYNKKYASKQNYFDETQVTSPGLYKNTSYYQDYLMTTFAAENGKNSSKTIYGSLNGNGSIG